MLDLTGEVKLVVDFPAALSEIISESKYMEQLGFAVPELARNVALMEEKYLNLVDGLEQMLGRLYGILETLDLTEAQLMVHHIAELKRIISPGLARINWNSLGTTRGGRVTRTR